MIYLLIAAFLWGTSFIAGKIAYDMLDPSLVVAIRYVLASIILLPMTFSFMKKKEESFTKKDFILLVILGILTYPLTSMLQFIGLSFTSASSATTIIGIEPVMITIVGFIFFKEKASPIVFLLGIIAFFGVALTVGVSALENVSFFGCFLVFLSTSFFLGSTFKKNTYKNELKLLHSINYSIRNIICFANNAIFS